MMAIARLTAGGVLDTAFDADGKRTVDFGGALSDISIANSVLASADGERMYAVGWASFAGNRDFAMARLLGDGSLDASFASDGSTTFGFDIAGNFIDVALDAVELPGGKLLVCGGSTVVAPANVDFSCMRLLANGTVDSDFLPALIPFDLDDQEADTASATRIDAQGRIVLVGGATAGPSGSEFAIARLLPSGQVDPTFGIDGRMTYGGEIDSAGNAAYSMALQNDGKIVLAGPTETSVQNINHVQVVRVIGDTLFEGGFDDGG